MACCGNWNTCDGFVNTINPPYPLGISYRAHNLGPILASFSHLLTVVSCRQQMASWSEVLGDEESCLGAYPSPHSKCELVTQVRLPLCRLVAHLRHAFGVTKACSLRGPVTLVSGVRLTFQSAPGQGTCVCVTLPRADLTLAAVGNPPR